MSLDTTTRVELKRHVLETDVIIKAGEQLESFGYYEVHDQSGLTSCTRILVADDDDDGR